MAIKLTSPQLHGELRPGKGQVFPNEAL
jgi:hypothetical protein